MLQLRPHHACPLSGPGRTPARKSSRWGPVRMGGRRGVSCAPGTDPPPAQRAGRMPPFRHGETRWRPLRRSPPRWAGRSRARQASRSKTGSCPPLRKPRPQCQAAVAAKRRIRRDKPPKGPGRRRTSKVGTGALGGRGPFRRPVVDQGGFPFTRMRLAEIQAGFVYPPPLPAWQPGPPRHAEATSSKPACRRWQAAAPGPRSARRPPPISPASTAAKNSRSGQGSGRRGPGCCRQHHKVGAELPTRPGKGHEASYPGHQARSAGPQRRQDPAQAPWAFHRHRGAAAATIWRREGSTARRLPVLPPGTSGVEAHPRLKELQQTVAGSWNTSETPKRLSAAIPIGPWPSPAVATRRTPKHRGRGQHHGRQPRTPNRGLGSAATNRRQRCTRAGPPHSPERSDRRNREALGDAQGRARGVRVSRENENSIGSGPRSEGFSPGAWKRRGGSSLS